MRGYIFSVISIILFVAIFMTSVSARSYRSSPSDVHVNGYFRKNGTYVQPYYRTPPNNTKLDNYDCIDHGNCGNSVQQPLYVAPTLAPYVPPPTSTPYISPPTWTPYPTQIPFPTLKPYPTYTSYPTYTFLVPTNTPTPEPTNTPTPKPINTRTPSPTKAPIITITSNQVNNIVPTINTENKQKTTYRGFWDWLMSLFRK